MSHRSTPIQSCLVGDSLVSIGGKNAARRQATNGLTIEIHASNRQGPIVHESVPVTMNVIFASASLGLPV
jgi:hypothetical protein